MTELAAQTLEEAFPVVEPGAKPLGARILVQLRQTKKTSKSGIVLVEETKEAEKDRKSTRLNSSHVSESRMPSSA